MTFVNEYIPKEDFEHYGFALRDDANPIGATRSDQWTIDRERDMFLRGIAQGREERCGWLTYCFFWRGHWTSVCVGVTEAGGTRHGPQWATYKLIDLQIPAKVEAQREEYLRDLKAAFVAYKDFGVRSNATEFTAKFDF